MADGVPKLVAGHGACPYAAEAVVNMLPDRGFETGKDLNKLAEISSFSQTLRNAA